MTNLINVVTKANKRRPSEPTSYFVELTGVSSGSYSGIAVHKNVDGNMTEGSAFKIGDSAEYDSYNLSYYGRITKITDKCVTIVAYPDSAMARAHRLDLNAFCWRNFKFNVKDACTRNTETSMYI